MSRITVVTDGSDNVIEQIEKQLNKLVDVVKVLDLTADEHIEREIVLLKLFNSKMSRPVLELLSNEYGARSWIVLTIQLWSRSQV